MKETPMKILSIALLVSFTMFAMPAMAQTALTVQDVSETAYQLSFDVSDQASGNTVANPNGDVFLLIKSVAGTSSITIDAPNSSIEVPGYGPLAKSDLTITVGAGEQKIVGPFQTRAWNSSAGKLVLSYLPVSQASTSIKAFRLKPSLR